MSMSFQSTIIKRDPLIFNIQYSILRFTLVRGWNFKDYRVDGLKKNMVNNNNAA